MAYSSRLSLFIEGRRGAAGVGDHLDPLIDEFVKARVIGGAVNEDRMRLQDADELFRPFFKAFPVDVLSRAAAGGADAGVST